MLTKKQLEKYADVLIRGATTARGKKCKRGDIFSILFELSGLPLAEVVFSKVMKMGMNPVLDMYLPSRIEHSYFKEANNNQLEFIAPGRKKFSGSINAEIIILSPDSLTHLKDIDPKKISKRALTIKPLRKIEYKRELSKELGWTLCMMPTDALAEKANMSMEDYEKQIIMACYLDREDPVQEWKNTFQKAARIKKWLNKMDVEYYHVKSETIDLKVFPGENRQWRGISGRNIPSFELFLSPDYHYTEGTYFADQPSYRTGNYISWLKLEFKKGFVSDIGCDSDCREFVKNYLATDRGAKAVGEFSLTDKRFSKINRFMAETLYDENYGGKYGNCHIALGSSYLGTYEGNPAKLDKKAKERLGFNDSAIHWDLVNQSRKIVTAHFKNGKTGVIYENGMFAL